MERGSTTDVQWLRHLGQWTRSTMPLASSMGRSIGSILQAIEGQIASRHSGFSSRQIRKPSSSTCHPWLSHAALHALHCCCRQDQVLRSSHRETWLVLGSSGDRPERCEHMGLVRTRAPSRARNNQSALSSYPRRSCLQKSTCPAMCQPA